mgnify:CR=1 FL=1
MVFFFLLDNSKFVDAKAVFADEVAGHELFYVGDFGQVGHADFVFVRHVGGALDRGHDGIFTGQRQFNGFLAEFVGLLHVGF